MSNSVENLINDFYVTAPDVEAPFMYPVQKININGKKKSYRITFNILLFNILDPSKIELSFNYATRDGVSDYVSIPLNFDAPNKYDNANIRFESDLALLPDDIATFNLELLSSDGKLLDKRTFYSHVLFGDSEK